MRRVRTICPLGARPEPGNSGYSPRHRMLPLIKVFMLNELGYSRKVKGESCNCTITEELTTANPEKCVEDHTGLPGLGLSHRDAIAAQSRLGLLGLAIVVCCQVFRCAHAGWFVSMSCSCLDRLKLVGPRETDGSDRLPGVRGTVRRERLKRQDQAGLAAVGAYDGRKGSQARFLGAVDHVVSQSRCVLLLIVELPAAAKHGVGDAVAGRRCRCRV